MILAVATVAVLLGLQSAGQGQTTSVTDLKTRLESRYNVVPLQQGVALVPRQAGAGVRMIQIADGVVTLDGEIVTGRQLRERLGADADLVLQVSYLSQEQQRELAGAAAGSGTGVVADQSPQPPTAAPPPSPAPPLPPPSPPAVERTDISRGDRVRFGGDITVDRNERVEGDVVAIGGSVTVNGEVTGDVTSIGGTLTLGPDAVVRGDAVSVGGAMSRAPGARIDGEVVDVGRGRGDAFRRGWFFPMMFGPFWPRLSSLAATVLRLSLLVLLGVIAVAFGRGSLERIASRTSVSPVRAGLVGLLAEILFVPVVVLTVVVLAVSIVGIPLLALVPFAILLLVVVMVVGFLGLAYHIGRLLTARFGWTERGAYAAVAIGVVGIGALTLIAKLAALAGGFIIGAPLTALGYFVEYVAWTVGFGAAILAWYESQTRFGAGRRAAATPPVAPPVPPPTEA
jgi:hypothetical protein